MAALDFNARTTETLFSVSALWDIHGEPVTYVAGDTFVLKLGWVGVWKTIETVRKVYVTIT